MKTKLLTLFVALIATTALWASNVITYTATEKLPEVTTDGWVTGLHINAFNVAITSHEFSNGIGTITFAGEVTTIGKQAFYSCSDLTSVTIGNSVTTIGESAFSRCSGLTSVTIPNSVTTIGERAFSNCSSLTSINVDAANTHYCSVDGVLFNYAKDAIIQYPANNSKTTYTIPNSVTTIGDYAFAYCSGLTSVTIPNSVTTIRDYAFSGCSGLTSVTIPNSVTTIGEGAFWNCSGLISPIYNANCFAYMPTSFKGAYTIPDGIEQIAGGAFADCSGLTSVTIPNSVTTIRDYAFSGCSGLTSVTIPNSVTTIGEGAFADCSGLTSVTIPNSVTTIEYGAFYGCSGLTSVTIPNSVTTIGDYAFWDCSGLTSVTINSKSIVEKSYSYDNNIGNIFGTQVKEYIIGDSVTTIGDYAFSGCNLSSITIPNSVKTIGDYAFYNCKRISTVTFGSGLWEIGNYAFSGDYRIADITCYAEVTPTIYAYTFEGITKKNVYLYVPENVIRRYQIDPYWNEFDIRTKSADVKPITGDQATVLPSANDAILTWPISNGAYTYTITITKGGETICLLTFNAQGQLVNIAFKAPAADGAHQAPAATLTAQGYQFTVTGLNPGTAYNYSVTATDAEGKTLAEHKGNFSTTGGESDLQNIRNGAKAFKYFHNGNLIIERNGVKYTPAGQKVK